MRRSLLLGLTLGLMAATATAQTPNYPTGQSYRSYQSRYRVMPVSQAQAPARMPAEPGAKPTTPAPAQTTPAPMPSTPGAAAPAAGLPETPAPVVSGPIDRRTAQIAFDRALRATRYGLRYEGPLLFAVPVRNGGRAGRAARAGRRTSP